jgi:hypothetical protein
VIIGLALSKLSHYFLSHKKRQSIHGNPFCMAARLLHSCLQAAGYTGFLDVDNLSEISESALRQTVQDSVCLLVLLSDQTCDSQWCRIDASGFTYTGSGFRISLRSVGTIIAYCIRFSTKFNSAASVGPGGVHLCRIGRSWRRPLVPHRSVLAASISALPALLLLSFV